MLYISITSKFESPAFSTSSWTGTINHVLVSWHDHDIRLEVTNRRPGFFFGLSALSLPIWNIATDDLEWKRTTWGVVDVKLSKGLIDHRDCVGSKWKFFKLKSTRCRRTDIWPMLKRPLRTAYGEGREAVLGVQWLLIFVSHLDCHKYCKTQTSVGAWRTRIRRLRKFSADAFRLNG
jgi:hypothetical protein